MLAFCHCAPLYIRSHFPQEVLYSKELNRENIIHFQTEICSSKQLDCVNSLLVDKEDCLELCEGTIADVDRLDNAKNEDGMTILLEDYERFKFHDSLNLSYPSTGHGTYPIHKKS